MSDRVLCHLCGRWFRSVVAHLHGWDHLTYRETFGLLRGESLEGTTTRGLRAKAMTVRRVQDPAVRAGCELGRSGAQTKAAAQAARGRRQPEQRRRKTLAALASISPRARAEGSRRRADEHLRVTAQQAATRLGFADSVAATLTERRHEQWDAAGCRWCARRPNRRTSAPAGPLQHPTRSHRAQRPPTHQPHPATNVTARYT